jgi:hypothetical protein
MGMPRGTIPASSLEVASAVSSLDSWVGERLAAKHAEDQLARRLRSAPAVMTRKAGIAAKGSTRKKWS